MFTEKPLYAAINREHSKSMDVRPALLADGTRGLVLGYAKFFAVLTEEDAYRLATNIADELQNGRH